MLADSKYHFLFFIACEGREGDQKVFKNKKIYMKNFAITSSIRSDKVSHVLFQIIRL